MFAASSTEVSRTPSLGLGGRGGEPQNELFREPATRQEIDPGAESGPGLPVELRRSLAEFSISPRRPSAGPSRGTAFSMAEGAFWDSSCRCRR